MLSSKIKIITMLFLLIPMAHGNKRYDDEKYTRESDSFLDKKEENESSSSSVYFVGGSLFSAALVLLYWFKSSSSSPQQAQKSHFVESKPLSEGLTQEIVGYEKSDLYKILDYNESNEKSERIRSLYKRTVEYCEFKDVFENVENFENNEDKNKFLISLIKMIFQFLSTKEKIKKRINEQVLMIINEDESNKSDKNMEKNFLLDNRSMINECIGIVLTKYKVNIDESIEDIKTFKKILDNKEIKIDNNENEDDVPISSHNEHALKVEGKDKKFNLLLYKDVKLTAEIKKLFKKLTLYGDGNTGILMELETYIKNLILIYKNKKKIDILLKKTKALITNSNKKDIKAILLNALGFKKSELLKIIEECTFVDVRAYYEGLKQKYDENNLEELNLFNDLLSKKYFNLLNLYEADSGLSYDKLDLYMKRAEERQIKRFANIIHRYNKCNEAKKASINALYNQNDNQFFIDAVGAKIGSLISLEESDYNSLKKSIEEVELGLNAYGNV